MITKWDFLVPLMAAAQIRWGWWWAGVTMAFVFGWIEGKLFELKVQLAFDGLTWTEVR